MIIQSVSSNGAQVAPNDDEKFSRWIWRDQVTNALRQLESPSITTDSVQLTTGISVEWQDARDLLEQINAARRQATRRARTGYAS